MNKQHQAIAEIIGEAGRQLRTPLDRVKAAHDRLSGVLESEHVGNDEVRDAVIAMCDALNKADL